MRKIMRHRLFAAVTLAIMGAFLCPGGVQATDRTEDHQNITGDVIAAGIAEGNLENNTLTVANGSNITGSLYGAQITTGTGDAKNNTVTVDNSSIQVNGSFSGIYAGYSQHGNVEGNTVIIQNGSTIGENVMVYAGMARNVGNAKKNTVTIDNSTVNGMVIAGQSSAGSSEVSENSVTIKGSSTAKNEVYGGYYYSTASGSAGTVTGNTVTIEGSSKVENNVFGGYNNSINSAKAEKNEVTIKESTVTGNAFGAGVDGAGDVTNNTVTISGGSTIGNQVIGGNTGINYASASVGNAENNTVTISGKSKVAYDVSGGRAWQGNANGNKVTITGESEIQYGGVNGGLAAKSGNAENNTVVIEKSTIAGLIYGGNTGTGNVNKNSVTITDSTVNSSVYGGGVWQGDATNNTLTISGSTITNNVIGGSSSGNGKVSGNTVNVSNQSTLKGLLYGGYAGSSSTDATDNTVNVTDSTIDLTVYGGYAGGTTSTSNANKNTVMLKNTTAEAAVGGSSLKGKAEGNTVTIDGGYVKKRVDGGTVQNTDADDVAVNNTVNLTNNPTFDATAVVYGGYIWRAADGTTDRNIGVKTGNTLNVTGSKNISLGNIGGFANINIEVPKEAVNGDSILILKAAADTDIAGSTVTAKLVGDTQLSAGDKVYVINKESGELLTTGTVLKATAMEGVSVIREVTLTQEDNDLVMTLVSATEKATPTEHTTPTTPTEPTTPTVEPSTPAVTTGLLDQTKSFVETRAAGAAMVNKAADQFVTSSIAEAVALAGANEGMVPFATMGGGKSRLATGSHVDLVHRSVNLGLAKMLRSEKSKLTFGPFFEYGWGSYDSYLDSGVHGEGDLHHTGGGLFIRDEKNDGLYLEGSLRVGKVKSDYKSRSIAGADEVSYNSSSTYYGAHVGLGKIFTYDNANQLDIYGRYMYSRTGSDSAKLSSGETYEFDAVNSNRFMLGGRYTLANGFYSGLAWQYEASGSAQASYKGLNTAAPSLHGHTGMLELGWKMDSSKTWELDLGVTGYAGQDRGVGLHLGAAYHF